MKGSLALVSMRKRMVGECFLTNLVSSRTNRGYPKPWQFQLMQFIGLGGAVEQPSSLGIEVQHHFEGFVSLVHEGLQGKWVLFAIQDHT